jgi:hypothetical protein
LGNVIVVIDWKLQLIVPLQNIQLIAPAWYSNSLVGRIVQQLLAEFFSRQDLGESMINKS